MTRLQEDIEYIIGQQNSSAVDVEGIAIGLLVAGLGIYMGYNILSE